MKVIIRPLFTYYSSVSKKQKRKGPAAHCSISPHRMAPGKGHVDAAQIWGIFLLPRSPQKGDCLFMDLWARDGLGAER